ncbi:MAG: antibiotic biosynthesis monooxygenase family protein [Tepidiformaceae bacterium]
MAVLSYFPISLPPEARAGFEQTWKNRVGAVDTFLGFISTELVALPDRGEYVVLTRFQNEAAFEAWITSDNFTRGHRGESYASYKDNPYLKSHKLFDILSEPVP